MVLMGTMPLKGGDGTILYNHSEIVELARLGYTSS